MVVKIVKDKKTGLDKKILSHDLTYVPVGPVCNTIEQACSHIAGIYEGMNPPVPQHVEFGVAIRKVP